MQSAILEKQSNDQGAGVPKKEWPKKPIWAQKPKAPAALIEEEACEDGVEQEVDLDEDV